MSLLTLVVLAVVLGGMNRQYDVNTIFKWSLASNGVSTYIKGRTLLCHLADTTATQHLRASGGRATQTRHCGGSKDRAFTKGVLTSMPTCGVGHLASTSSKKHKASYATTPHPCLSGPCLAPDNHAPRPPPQTLVKLGNTLLTEGMPQATAAAIVHAFRAECGAPPLQHQHFLLQIGQGELSLWSEVENAAMAAENSKEPPSFSSLTPSLASYDLARHASPSFKKHEASYATTTIPCGGGVHSPCYSHTPRPPLQ